MSELILLSLIFRCVFSNEFYPRAFTDKLQIIDRWRGRRDEELSVVSGVPGGIYVHSSGFIGGLIFSSQCSLSVHSRVCSHLGNKTKEGALQLAIKALSSKTLVHI